MKARTLRKGGLAIRRGKSCLEIGVPLGLVGHEIESIEVK